MRILRWDHSDPAALRACHEVQRAAQQADDPLGPPKSARVLRTWLAEGWEGNPCEAWYAADEPDGTARGLYWLELPDRENLDRAVLIIMLRPDLGGGDIKGALLRHAAARAHASGRVVLTSACHPGTPVSALLRSAGAAQCLTEVRRVLDLRKAPPGRFGALRESAARKAAGYSLVTWTGPVPEQHLAGAAAVLNAMNDAPREGQSEDTIWDAERVRERADSSQLKMGLRGYSVAATHDVSGEMAGLTQVFIDPATPEWGYQGLTAVTRPHRGHRLGMLVKAAMLEWLAEAEPRLERIYTGNADSNRHMIAVNEALGCEVLDPPWELLELAVADALRTQA